MGPPGIDGQDGLDGEPGPPVPFDSVVPTTSAIADAAASGAAVVAARRDHVHGREDISAMSNSQPAGNETIPANYGAIIPGLPYVIANGFVTTVAAGGVLVLDNSTQRERPRYFLQDTAPTAVLEGDIWISLQTNQTLVYDGSLWRTLEGQPGDLKMAAYSTATTPNYGWLLCDGSAVSRATYVALFNAIGTTFGVGDSLTTFNVPDYRGRVPVGSGTGTGGGASGSGAPTGGSALTARTIGSWVGEETHLLTSTESGVPVHVHLPATGSTGFIGGNFAGANAPGAGATVSLFSATGNNTAADAAAAHNTMPPVQVAHFYIRY
jgi:microcystin-dependent protein